MKIVILGAGASYDCINKYHEKGYELEEVLKWRPPLGNDILGSRENFREIYDLYPGAQNFSHAINASSDIEEFFQKKWNQAIDKNDNVTLANLINTQYCFQHLFYEISKHYSRNIGVNNYQTLLQQAHDYTKHTGEEVAFITFNYDLLLEYELIKYQAPNEQIDMNTYTRFPIKIFKPHGSCNWVRKFSKGLPNDIVSYILKEKFSLATINEMLDDEIEINYFNFIDVDRNHTNEDLFIHQIEKGLRVRSLGQYIGYFPQLLIPMKEKDEFVMPKEHEELMKDCLSKMTDLLVIGWKGQEAKFLDLLKEINIKTQINITGVTCGENQIFDELGKVITNKKTINYIADFYRVKDLYSYPHDVIHDHKIGTFSSFILNTENKLTKSFFEY
jgi:hypothetical protein